MSTITEAIWDIITDTDELHSELTRIMRQSYEPFLTHYKATTVNTFKLESYFWIGSIWASLFSMNCK